MKSKSGVDSKAGTLKMKNSKEVLRNLISKSASMLLIAMAGFGMMSFTQDDTVVNSIDTNLSVKKEVVTEGAKNISDEKCCVAQVTKPGDEIKKTVYINMPYAKGILIADMENSRLFAKEATERRIWTMDVAQARANADKEMNLNFELSKLNPSAVASAKADELMNNLFVEEAMVKFTNTVANSAIVADAEVISQFVAANFTIAVKADAAIIAKADASMIKAFEKENLPLIGLPAHVAAATADAEMFQNYEKEVKQNTTVATK